MNKDVNHATLLFELERLGVLKRVASGAKLIRGVNYVNKTPGKGIELLARDNDTLVQAVEENLFEAQETRNLHLRTEYDNIFREDIPKIREWLFSQGALFHKRAREYLSKFDKDINPRSEKEGGGTVVISAFSWTSKPSGDGNHH